MTYKKKFLGYIVRSKQNSSMILCTDGQWHWDGIVGPANPHSAKLYKRQGNAKKVRQGDVIIEEQWA